MQPNTDQWGQPVQPVYGQPPQQQVIGQPPQPQIIGQPAVLTGQPTMGHAPIQVTNVMMNQSNGAATASMIMGIISFLMFLSGFILWGAQCCSMPLAIIGVALGHVGYGNSKTTGVGGGEAMIGLILNWLQVGLLLIGLILILIFGVALIGM
ncbi:MAG TPA: hypothetical protein QF802_01900 [Candidatus Thalassarchaeaceae archaeon]|nr:hypothetical protein [Candidatus Thalassarchaeaceae archaeon]